MTLIKRHWIIAVLVVIAVGIFAAFQFKGSDQPQYFTAKADRGDIHDVVEATGTINAVTTVQVGSQVSGTIYKLFADYNSRVKQGQIVAEIDPALFKGALVQAQANLANAQANLLSAKANLAKAKATAVQGTTDYQRTVGLAKEGVMSPQDLDQAKATADSDVAAVAAAEALVSQGDAQVKQQEAAVNVAQTNLDYTVIHAPIDGTVIARSVDVGQTVAASLQAPTLFTIAQDLTKMQVYAATDESDVGMIRTGQVVTFKVDAYPKDTFTGKVSQIRLNATTVQNVVTYNTIIDFQNPELKLFPGMTAYITIPVANATNALRVPNGALRYKPDLPAAQLRALFQKYGLSPSAGPGGQHASQTPGNGQGPAMAMSSGQGRPRPQGTEGGGGDASTKAQHVPPVDVAIVWKLTADKNIEPVRIRTGITDHTLTEVAQVLKGELKPGDELVTGSMAGSRGPRPPGLGRP